MTLGQMAASAADVYQVLSDAASQDPARVQAGLQGVQTLQKQPGAFAEFQNVAATRTVDPNIRRQAIIQFKNGVLSHWRSRVLFPEEQKSVIRNRTMLFLDEEDEVIADMNTQVVARIARGDYPKQWPTLTNDLLRVIQTKAEERLLRGVADTQSTLTLKRSLKLLDQVIKELALIKMPAGIQTMTQLVVDIQGFVGTLYGRMTVRVQESLTPDGLNSSRLADDMEILHTCFKCLVRMMLWLFNKPKGRNQQEDEVFQAFFQSSVNQFQTLCDLRISLTTTIYLSGMQLTPAAARCLHFLFRHVRHYAKMFRRMQQLRLREFVTLPLGNTLVLYFWKLVVRATSCPPELVSDSQHAVYPTQFLVQGMVIFRESLSQWSTEGKEHRMTDAATAVLSKEFVEESVRLIVTRFIPLQGTDLERWMADPEEWVNMGEKEADAWEFDLRACAERVLMTLSTQYPSYVVPLLVQTFNAILQQPTTDLTSILQKEALYCAVGRCAHRLKDQINFDEWLSKYLAVEAQQLDPNFRIMKRRIAWTIGKWFHEECAPATSEKVWVVLLHLLQDQGSGSDFVVRLTAAAALKECIDTLTFSVDVFKPFLGGVVAGLVQLIAEADTLESKRRVLASLNTVIESVGDKIVPFMSLITTPIPSLCEELLPHSTYTIETELFTIGADSETDFLVKASLLETVKVLVLASRQHSVSLHSIVVALIQESLKDETKVQLDEDGFDLWVAALRSAPSLEVTPPGVVSLFDLVPTAVHILSTNLDLLGKILSIVEGYVILNATALLQMAGVDLYRACGQCIGQALNTNVRHVLITLNLIVQVAPSVLWAESMHSSGLFSDLLNTVVGEKEKGSDQVMIEVLYVFARMSTQDPLVFVQLISATAAHWNLPETQIWNKLLDQWWRKFDNMGEPRHRKLTAMGLASLVSRGRPEVMERLSGEILNMWLDVLGEMKEALESSDDGSHLHLYWKAGGDEPPASFLQESEGTLEETRRRNLYAQDPIQSQRLTSYISAKLDQAALACGGIDVLQRTYMAKADPLVVQQLQTALSA